MVELWHAQSAITVLFPNTNPYNLRDTPYLRVTGLILAFFPSKLQQAVSMYTLRTLTERNNQKWLSGTISMVRPRLLANTLHTSPSPTKKKKKKKILATLTLFFWWFLCGPFLKSLLNFVTILPLFYVLLLWPRGMWDRSSLTRDGTHSPCIGTGSLTRRTSQQL